MSMTYSENYYTNFMLDKMYDLRDKGDKRTYEVMESHFWHYHVDELKAENDRLKKDIIELIELGTDQVVTEKIKALEEKLESARRVIENTVKACEFFSQHADCRKDSWMCNCSFCKPNDHSKNMRLTREWLRQNERTSES